MNFSCINSGENCEPNFFENYNKSIDSVNLNIFKAKEIKCGSLCCYKIKFSYWVGFNKDTQFIPLFSLDGNLFKKNNSIFLLINGEEEKVKFFDFGMRNGDKENIVLKYNSTGYDEKPIRIVKNYTLKLDERFYDDLRKDTIYKFRFIKWNSQNNFDDLIFFVGKTYGIAGIYSSKTNDSKEEIFTYRGEIFKSRMKNSNVIFNSDIK